MSGANFLCTRIPRSLSLLLLPTLCFLASHASPSLAGGGPQNVFLVVNANSEDSKAVANHYIALRHIPPSNVFYVEYQGNLSRTASSRFRKLILDPTIQEIDDRGLSKQIDYIVYSCDFPYRVNFGGEFSDENLPKQLRPLISLTGATYLWPFVQAGRKELCSLNNNFYHSSSSTGLTLTRGFQSEFAYAPTGKRSSKGMRYMLSAMLGVTIDRGNSVSEIVHYLERAASADGTQPKGTVYYARNDDIRSKTRHDTYKSAAREVQLAGVHAEVVDAVFPQHKSDIIGVSSGKARVGVQRSGSTFLPGALVDNFTSAGGQFENPKRPPGQTPISEFLRHGAAGACGTVVEPFAISQKFPSATIHLHYVRGCSLAEAFYQSVSGPFQQLLVGDPLCTPWAKDLGVKPEELEDGDSISGTVEIKPIATDQELTAIKEFDLYVNGKHHASCAPGQTLTLNTTEMEDGYHQLHLVGTDRTPIEMQDHWRGEVSVSNGRDALQILVDEQNLGSSNQVAVRVVSTNAAGVTLWHNGRIVGASEKSPETIYIKQELLGSGPVTLTAISEGDPGLRSRTVTVALP